MSARIPLRPASTVDAARQALAADQRQGWRRLVVLPAVLALVLVLLPVGAVVGQAALSRISPTARAALRVGQPESEARARLPRLDMQSPPPQVGIGECHHYETTFSPFDRTDVIEVCFAGGRLASTTVIAAP